MSQNTSELTTIAIYQVVRRAISDPYYRALRDELTRLYLAAGETLPAELIQEPGDDERAARNWRETLQLLSDRGWNYVTPTIIAQMAPDPRSVGLVIPRIPSQPQE